MTAKYSPVLLDFSRIREERSQGVVGHGIKTLTQGLVDIDLAYLRAHPETPLLAASGVRYDAGVQDAWRDIPCILAEKVGGAVDLTAWRVAELRWAGEEATFDLWRMPWGLMPVVQRADGTAEQPWKDLQAEVPDAP